jgi:N-dimethylarginine dimethylaminohydrolase
MKMQPDKIRIGQYKRKQEFIHLRECLEKCWNEFKAHDAEDSFPEKAFADQNISLVEDICREMAVVAAEIQEIRKGENVR